MHEHFKNFQPTIQSKAMNFIHEVVEIVNENEQVDARKNLTKLNNEIRTYQSRVRKHIDKKYSNFLPDIIDNEDYIHQCEAFLDENTNFLNHLNKQTKAGVDKTSDDVASLQKILEENVLGLQTCQKLLNIDQKLKSVRKLNSLHNFSKAIAVLGELKTLIYDPEESILPKLDCYENIRISYVQESEQFLYNVRQRFESLVEFKDKTFQSNKAISIKISRDDVQLHDTILALVTTNYNPRTLCNFLISNVLEPIITKQATVKFVENEPDSVKLFVSYNLQHLEPHERSDYRIVFRNIKKVFSCLSYMNVSIAEDRCVFSMFAEHIKDTFLELLINECLSYSIPNNVASMKESTLIADITELHDYLCELLFLNTNDEEDQRMLKYAEKIGVLFSKRFGANITKEATAIMKKDLHDAIKVETPLIRQSILADCMISKSTVEVIQLLEYLIKNSNEVSDEEGKNQMIQSASKILERYVDIVSSHHEKLLENIPQQAAFFHNNCLYLAEWTNITKGVNAGAFANVAQYLTDQGEKNFQKQVKLQQKTLLENLNGLEFAESVSEIGPEPVRIIRKCLRQLEVLKNVWENILPESVYNKTISLFLNDLCTDIIKKMCQMEDIASVVANELEELIDLIQKKGPQLFKVSGKKFFFCLF